MGDLTLYLTEIESSELFSDVTITEYPWSHIYTTNRYIELLQTQSDHRLLSDTDRARLFDAVAAAMDDTGSQLTLDYEAGLLLARRI